MKKVFIKTYGCQMNERDSEAVAALLAARGYRLTDSETDADVILLNTCSVRDRADQKALNKMASLAHLKRKRPAVVLGFLGCMAQVRGVGLLQDLPGVDLVVGTQRFHHLPEYLDRLWAARQPIVDVAAEAGSESAVKDHVLDVNGNQRVTAFVSIMQGCNMQCTFCIVPATRGPERSRPIPEIVEEVRQLVSVGVKEVTLLGQIVTSYGRMTGGKSEFVKLLTAVHDVPGLERLRFTSPHPKGFGDDLVQAYRDLPKLCEYAHLPVQTGSDRILKAMKRGYTRDSYLRIVEKLRTARPGIGLGTDIIVGFPGETDEDFAATLALVQEVGFDQAYLFKYSPRRGTPAADLPNQVSREVKEQRHRILLNLINENVARKNAQRVGATVEVLVEGRSPKNPARLFGRTRTNHGVVLAGGDDLRGRLVPVRITRANRTTLYGELT